MTEQYQCQSYSDDNRVVQDCTCGKCVETPDTEWEKEIRFNPRAMGKKILSDKMIVEEVRKGDNYVVWKSPKTTVHIIPDSKLREMLTSRDNYWKERVDRVLIAMSWREENETSEAIRVLAEIRERLVVTNEDNLK